MSQPAHGLAAGDASRNKELLDNIKTSLERLKVFNPDVEKLVGSSPDGSRQGKSTDDFSDPDDKISAKYFILRDKWLKENQGWAGLDAEDRGPGKELKEMKAKLLNTEAERLLEEHTFASRIAPTPIAQIPLESAVNYKKSLRDRLEYQQRESAEGGNSSGS